MESHPGTRAYKLLIENFPTIANRIALPTDNTNLHTYFHEFQKSNPNVSMFRLPFANTWRNGQILVDIGGLQLAKTAYQRPETRSFDHIIILEGEGIFKSYNDAGQPIIRYVKRGEIIIADAWYEYTLECRWKVAGVDLFFLAITDYNPSEPSITKSIQPATTSASTVLPSLPYVVNTTHISLVAKDDNVFPGFGIAHYKSMAVIKLKAYEFGRPTYHVDISASGEDVNNHILIVVAGQIEIYTRTMDNITVAGTSNLFHTNDIIRVPPHMRKYMIINTKHEDAAVIAIKPSGIQNLQFNFGL